MVVVLQVPAVHGSFWGESRRAEPTLLDLLDGFISLAVPGFRKPVTNPSHIFLQKEGEKKKKKIPAEAGAASRDWWCYIFVVNLNIGLPF